MSRPLRFRGLGDSLAAGVGCQRADRTPGHLLAAALRSAGHQVEVRVHAMARARSTDLAAQVRAALAGGVDLALVIIGANDLTALLPPATARNFSTTLQVAARRERRLDGHPLTRQKG